VYIVCSLSVSLPDLANKDVHYYVIDIQQNVLKYSSDVNPFFWGGHGDPESRRKMEETKDPSEARKREAPVHRGGFWGECSLPSLEVRGL